jgi:hypothetical protein
MSNYFTRPGGAYIKINPTTQIVDLVLNIGTQKTLSSINDAAYYNNTVSASAAWPELSETEYNASKTEVLTYLSNI